MLKAMRAMHAVKRLCGQKVEDFVRVTMLQVERSRVRDNKVRAAADIQDRSSEVGPSEGFATNRAGLSCLKH